MKKKLNLLFPLLLLVASSCTKNTNYVNTDTSTIPQGNFLGTFSLIHKNSVSGKLDTSRAIITIAFSLSTISYSVAGDTSKIQAPSHGTYTADGTYITFIDATYKKNLPNLPKKHLNGAFLYTYTDSKNLHIYGSSDTLSYNYALTSY
jgi:hypothetical protein